MEYKKLGNSGLSIAPIIVGCMTFGDKSWAKWVLEDEEKIFAIMKKCYDNGLRTFDTANFYSNGYSEILLGKFIKKFDIPRDKIVILTKVFFPVDSRGPPGFNVANSNVLPFEYANSSGLSRKHIFDAVEDSVNRLGTYIDILQIHRLDKTTPKTEIMKALNDIITQGSARYIGASGMKATEFAQLQFIAEKNSWFKFISMQGYYNLLYREEEREMIPFCKDNELGKVGLIPFSPIARGLLARPLLSESQFDRNMSTDKTFKILGLDNLSEADREIINRVEIISKKRNASMAVISIAWVLHKGAMPIVGLNSEERVGDILQAVSFELSEEEITYLEEPYKPKDSYI